MLSWLSGNMFFSWKFSPSNTNLTMWDVPKSYYNLSFTKLLSLSDYLYMFCIVSSVTITAQLSVSLNTTLPIDNYSTD